MKISIETEIVTEGWQGKEEDDTAIMRFEYEDDDDVIEIYIDDVHWAGIDWTGNLRKVLFALEKAIQETEKE